MKTQGDTQEYKMIIASDKSNWEGKLFIRECQRKTEKSLGPVGKKSMLE